MGTARKGRDRRHTYEGQYVALSSSEHGRVIASGRKMGPVYDEARKQGETIPTIIFVPKGDTGYYY